MPPRVVALTAFLICITVKTVFGQASDIPIEFDSPCDPFCLAALIAQSASTYPTVASMSLVQGAATLSAATPGDFSKPWTINERISGMAGAPVALQVTGGFAETINSQFDNGQFGIPQHFVLTAVNATAHPWNAFQIELQSVLGEPSNQDDGLALGDRPNLPSSATSTKFGSLQAEYGAPAVLLFSGGTVNPGESVTFTFPVMQRNVFLTFPSAFYIVQRPLFVVPIDLKPQGNPNCVNPAANGLVPVAVFGDAAFSVSSINQATLRFNGGSPSSCQTDDVPKESSTLVFNKKDSFPDLVCHFPTAAVSWPAPGTNCGTVALGGSLNDGTPFYGFDTACLAAEVNCSTGAPTPVDPIRIVDGFSDTLTFTQDPASFTIPFPGLTASPKVITVTSKRLSIGFISVPYVGTSNGGDWLVAGVSGSNTINVSIANTSTLVFGASYSGTVTVRANNDPATDSVLNVTLQVGADLKLVGSLGVILSPPFITSQMVTVITEEGFVVPVVASLSNPSIPFVNVAPGPNGSVIVTYNGSITTPGVYSGTLELFNVFFALSKPIHVPVTLVIR